MLDTFAVFPSSPASFSVPIWDVPAPDDLRDVDRHGDVPAPGLHDDLGGAALEVRDDRQDVVHHRLLPDVHAGVFVRHGAPPGAAHAPGLI
jgi:hypothetical protein